MTRIFGILTVAIVVGALAGAPALANSASQTGQDNGGGRSAGNPADAGETNGQGVGLGRSDPAD